MKSLLATLSVLLLAVSAWSASVVFNLRDFLQGTPGLIRRAMVVEPLSTVKGNVTNLVITSERRYFNTGTNGVVNTTNMIGGLYRVSVMGNTWTSVFRINVPDTNGTLQASDLITSTPSSALDLEDGTPIDIE